MSGSPDAAPTPVRTLGADTPPKIKVGDEVELVVRGKIKAAPQGWDHLGYWFQGFWLNSPDIVSVEVLSPPTPTYKAGDIVRDIVGSTFARQHESHAMPWRLLSTHAGVDPRYREEGPTRPLTLLVRDGKTVG